jgi:hypothetical protein
MSVQADNSDRENLSKLLPVVSGRVQAVVSAKGRWTDQDLNTRTIQVCNSNANSLICSSLLLVEMLTVHNGICFV